MKFKKFLEKEKHTTNELYDCIYNLDNVSKILNVKKSTCSRWSRDFFSKGKDLKEIQKEGIEKTYNIDDVFLFYITKCLFRFESMSQKDVIDFWDKAENWIRKIDKRSRYTIFFPQKSPAEAIFYKTHITKEYKKNTRQEIFIHEIYKIDSIFPKEDAYKNVELVICEELYRKIPINFHALLLEIIVFCTKKGIDLYENT